MPITFFSSSLKRAHQSICGALLLVCQPNARWRSQLANSNPSLCLHANLNLNNTQHTASFHQQTTTTSEQSCCFLLGFDFFCIIFAYFQSKWAMLVVCRCSFSLSLPLFALFMPLILLSLTQTQQIFLRPLFDFATNCSLRVRSFARLLIHLSPSSAIQLKSLN